MRDKLPQANIWLRGQAVKTLASHAGIRGSIPLGVTKKALESRLFFIFEFLERGQTYNLLIYHEDGMPEIKADVVDPGKLRKLEIVFFSGISYNREVLKNPRRGIRIGGEENVSISNRNASESKSRPLCSGPVQHQQP